MTPIPTLTTQRLSLRPMALDDWPAYEAMMQSERARYMGGPFDLKAAWGLFCADHAQWDLFGCGALMMEDRQTGHCLGQVGINSGPLFPEQEIGWFVYPEAEGRGYAQEAASALRDWAKDDRGLNTLVSYVDPGNERSLSLVKRLGAVLDARARRTDPTDLVFRHFG